MERFDVITCGEVMVLFSPMDVGPLRYVSQFCKYAAGAELNLSVALARLGLRAGFISKVGCDEFGQYILARMRFENLDTRFVKEDPAHPTGVYFKELSGSGESRVYYYRKGSAASTLRPEDVDPSWLDGAKLLHLTGITPALSESCKDTCLELIAASKSRNVKISFDPNIRPALHKGNVVSFMEPFIRACDILLMNEHECGLLFGSPDPAVVATSVFGMGPEIMVVKQGDKGAVAATRSGKSLIYGEPFKPARYVDPVGAGDGFDAGFLFGYLNGWPMEYCLKLGNFIGARATTVLGDHEGYPFRRDIPEDIMPFSSS